MLALRSCSNCVSKESSVAIKVSTRASGWSLARVELRGPLLTQTMKACLAAQGQLTVLGAGESGNVFPYR